MFPNYASYGRPSDIDLSGGLSGMMSYGNQPDYRGMSLPGQFAPNMSPQYADTNVITDKKGRGMFDPVTGQIIPKNQRRKEGAIERNPYNFKLGDIINPNIDYSPIRNISNPSISTSKSLLRR